MLLFKKIAPAKGKKSPRYAVINPKRKKRRRLGKIVRGRRYEFHPHPRKDNKITKTQQKEIKAFIDTL